MIARWFLPLLLPVLTLSCALLPGAPPLPATARTIAVLSPNNRTGDPLLVESSSFLHPYADRPGRVTVPDVLATQVREQLAQRGVEVIAPEAVIVAIGTQTPGTLGGMRLLWPRRASSQAAPSTSRYGVGKLICPPSIPSASSWLWKLACWIRPQGVRCGPPSVHYTRCQRQEWPLAGEPI